MASDPSDTAPATGSTEPEDTELSPEEEPNTTGTLFLTLIFQMLVFGFWMMMYIILLNR